MTRLDPDLHPNDDRFTIGDDITGIEVVCVVGLIVIIVGGLGYIALKLVGLL